MSVALLPGPYRGAGAVRAQLRAGVCGERIQQGDETPQFMYQLVLLGARAVRETALVNEIESGFRALGLDPGTLFKSSNSIGAVDLRYPVVGVWFGTMEPHESADLTAIVRLLAEGCSVFPVLDKGDDFFRVTPTALHEINGYSWDRGAERLAADILQAFGLTRDQRRAFVSYRREDCQTVAIQIFHALSDRGYRVFLDTAGVDFGVRFQEVLWDRMSDSDLLVFVDTPRALTSKWVNEELTQAHNHSLGVLQVVWPAWKPFEGTELNFRLLLVESDFESTAPHTVPGGAPNKQGVIHQTALDRITQAAETVRVRSLGSRRARLQGELVRAAVARGMESVVLPGGGINFARITSGTRAITGRAMPIVGMPTVERIFDAMTFLKDGGQTVRIVYDGLGASSERRAFLMWLDAQLAAYRCVSLDGVDTWLGAL